MRFLQAIFFFLIIPVLLIIFGTVKRRAQFGKRILASGLVVLSLAEAALLSSTCGKLVCGILSLLGISSTISNLTPIACVIFFAAMYLNDKLYHAIVKS